MDQQQLLVDIDQLWEQQVIPKLCEFIRIPNKSPHFAPDWQTQGHMEAAVTLLANWCQQAPVAGLRVEIARLPGRTPLLLCEIAATLGCQARTLLYGHYDKQPEFTGWHQGLGPWQPVLKDGRLYGRGGADDGYALFGCLSAIAALQAQGIPHGHCLILIEGCEESGSFDLPYYIEALVDRIGTPELVVCLDAECGNYDQLWLTNSLRGLVTANLHVDVLTEGVHSGAGSGIVPSSFRILRALLARIEDAETGDLPTWSQVDIPARIRQQATQVAATLGNEIAGRFPWHGNTRPISADLTELVLNNTWRPSLSVTGLSGAPELDQAGNTLRPGTAARLSLRLPPTLDATQAMAQLATQLLTDPPYGASVRLQEVSGQAGWAAPATAPWLAQALEAASKQYFGKPLRMMGTGGSIPFMRMLGERFPEVQFMVTGVLGPHSNAHGPNEFLHLATAKKVSAAVALVLAAQAAR